MHVIVDTYPASEIGTHDRAYLFFYYFKHKPICAIAIVRKLRRKTIFF